MGNWIRADYPLPQRVANIELPYMQVHQFLHGNAHRISRDPEMVEVFLIMLLSVANHGQYRDATLWRFFQPHDRHVWVMTIAHPSLPPVPDFEVLPVLALTVEAEDWQKLFAHVRERFAATAVNGIASEVSHG